MRWIWALLVSVVLAGVAAVFWPSTEAATPPPKPSEPPRVTTRPSTSSSPAPRAEPKASDAAPAPASVANPPPAKAVPSPANGLPLGLDRTIASARVLPGLIVRNADGSLTADGKHRIDGEGTRERPYRIDWSCLASASQTYVPRLKQDGIPQWVAMLDGAWVRIDGYVAFPLMLQETKEILCMLNQWDGCCIGVPPTPYDAIEVQLTEPLKPNRRHAFQFGAVTGRLRVDPMLVENWLVGLYRMEEATLRQDDM